MTDKPNIIYILGDDQRHEMLGCMGHPVVRTPHLDALAADGTLFTNAFCTSPLCTPSRACHYLGQWERRHGVNFNSGTALSPEAWNRSFPMRLRQAGYFTGWVGKNHVPIGRHGQRPETNGYPCGYMEESFDYWYGNHGHSTFYPKELPDGKGALYTNASDDTQPEVFAEGVRNFLSCDPAFANSCSRPLPTRDTEKPFCLCVTFNLPHCASTGTMQLRPQDDEIYKSLYRDRVEQLPLPPTYKAADEHYHKLPLEVYNGVQIGSYDFVRTEPDLRERMLRMCQTITGVDRFVGQLRTQLQELGLAEQTIIVFSTDHGIHFGEHGLGGKALLYEEALRIPMIVYDPRLPTSVRGQRRDELVVVEDLAPTVLDCCDIAPEPTMQGCSLRPLLSGKQPDWRDAIFAENLFDHQNYPRCEAIRTRTWKYIRYFRRREDPAQADQRIRGTLDPYEQSRLDMLQGESAIYEELYHLHDDPYEERNLAGDPDHAATLDEMRTRIQHEGLTALADVIQTDTVAITSRWAARNR